MPRIELPLTIVSELAALRRRVEQLERSKSIGSADLSGGNVVTVRDDGGAVLLKIGLLDDDTHGLAIYATNGTWVTLHSHIYP